MMFQFDMADLDKISAEASRQCQARGMKMEMDGAPNCGGAYQLLASGPVLQHCVGNFVCK